MSTEESDCCLWFSFRLTTQTDYFSDRTQAMSQLVDSLSETLGVRMSAVMINQCEMSDQNGSQAFIQGIIYTDHPTELETLRDNMDVKLRERRTFLSIFSDVSGQDESSLQVSDLQMEHRSHIKEDIPDIPEDTYPSRIEGSSSRGGELRSLTKEDSGLPQEILAQVSPTGAEIDEDDIERMLAQARAEAEMEKRRTMAFTQTQNEEIYAAASSSAITIARSETSSNTSQGAISKRSKEEQKAVEDQLISELVGGSVTGGDESAMMSVSQSQLIGTGEREYTPMSTHSDHSLASDVVKQEKRLEALRKINDQSRKEISDKEEVITLLEVDKKQLNLEVSTLKGQITEMEEKADQLRTALSQARNETLERDDEIDRLVNRLGAEEDAHTSSKERMLATETRLDAMRAAIDRERDSVLDRDSEIEESYQTIRSIVEEKGRLAEMAAMEINRLSRVINKLLEMPHTRDITSALLTDSHLS